MTADIFLNGPRGAVADALAGGDAMADVGGTEADFRHLDLMAAHLLDPLGRGQAGQGVEIERPLARDRRTATGRANSQIRPGSRQWGRSWSMSAPKRKNSSRAGSSSWKWARVWAVIIHAAAIRFVAADRERLAAGNRQFQHFDRDCGGVRSGDPVCAAARAAGRNQTASSRHCSRQHSARSRCP